MKLGQFKTIEEPDQPACWLHKNVRVKGYVGEVELPTDQYIMRPIAHLFQEACTAVRGVLPDGAGLGANAPVSEKDDAWIVSVEEIDDYGSLLFKWRYWGVPEK
jgi:hypothetical protein